MPIFSGVGCQHSQLKLLLLSGKLLNPKEPAFRYWLWRQLLIYPWRDWQAFFYGQVSTVARDALNARGSQLNSKLVSSWGQPTS